MVKLLIIIIVGGHRDENDDDTPMQRSENIDRVDDLLTSGKLSARLSGHSPQNIIRTTKNQCSF